MKIAFILLAALIVVNNPVIQGWALLLTGLYIWINMAIKVKKVSDSFDNPGEIHVPLILPMLMWPIAVSIAWFVSGWGCEFYIRLVKELGIRPFKLQSPIVFTDENNL